MCAVYFSLDQPIDAKKLIHKISNLIQKYQNINEHILKIDIVQVSSEQNIIPKIEYKSDENNI